MHQSRWLVLGTMAVLACNPPLDPTSSLDPMALLACTPQPVRVPPQAALSGPFGPYHPDSQWAEAARQVPGGFGGWFYEDGAVTVYLVDPSQHAEAAQALLEFGIHISRARVKQGLWDFAQLFDWYFDIKSRINEFGGGVHQTGIDEFRNRLVFRVEDEDTQETIITFLGSQDLPCELVIVEVRPMAVLY